MHYLNRTKPVCLQIIFIYIKPKLRSIHFQLTTRVRSKRAFDQNISTLWFSCLESLGQLNRVRQVQLLRSSGCSPFTGGDFGSHSLLCRSAKRQGIARNSNIDRFNINRPAADLILSFLDVLLSRPTSPFFNKLLGMRPLPTPGSHQETWGCLAHGTWQTSSKEPPSGVVRLSPKKRSFSDPEQPASLD